ncbi:lachesin-like [Coccinella septempunctata]|uniref:lachesin-like n=1 Tax=Coccinella septempunctata TaxID=41139 RepID=UPI001D0943E6|nr:lachesin-like [Coccinella septempunctata]
MVPEMVLFLFVLFAAVKGSSVYAGLNDLSDPSSNQQEQLPNFVTPGQTYRIATGSTVVLPCRISQPGSYVLAWKRGIAVLTAGPVKVSPDPRLRLLPSPARPPSLPGSVPELSGSGYSLELRDVKPHDAGDYVCQIGTMEPKEITHTLEILVPPRIHFVSHTGPVKVLQGATVKMECRASGNPVPTLSWTRENDALPSGEKTVLGLSMVIQHADRHSAGTYQCTADNGVGQPDTRHIVLSVMYGPEVDPERATIHTGLGLEAQLVCIVHAEPSPQVIWYKDTAQLGTTEQHATHSRGNRYTLVIRNVTRSDFGNYSCVASNVHGKGRSQIILTGVAGLAVFDSNSLGSEKENYNVTWSVNSHALITEYRVFYRMKPRHHRPGVEHRETFRTFANSTVKMDFSNQWNSVILPANPGADNPPYPGVTRQKMWYLMRQLQPGTTYEVRVQARNVHGWNKMSPIFHFTTKSNDHENMVEPSAQPAVYGIGSKGLFNPFNQASPTTVTSSVILIVSVAIFI